MGLTLGRMLAASLELIETGLGWIDDTRDRYVNYLVIWFYLNKEQIWIKFKKHPVVCLVAVLQLALIFKNSSLLGYEVAVPRWEATWIAGMSMFSTAFLTYKIFVEIKKFKLSWKKNRKVFCVGFLKVLFSAQLSDSINKVPTEMYNFNCYNPRERLPLGWGIESWMEATAIGGLPHIVLFTGLMFTVLCFYNKCGSLFTGFLIKEFNNLTEKIKNLVEKIDIKLKENRIEYLGAVFRILNLAFTSSLLRDAQIWKSYFIAGIAIFAFLCYWIEVSVELRRLEVTRTYIRPERMNNIVVWFFTKQHVLQCLIPLATWLYKSHQMEDTRESVSYIVPMSVYVVGQLAFMYARDRYHFYAAN
ncbi:hypothetical protein ACET3Z_030624 [Daucus carota]